MIRGTDLIHSSTSRSEAPAGPRARMVRGGCRARTWFSSGSFHTPPSLTAQQELRPPGHVYRRFHGVRLFRTGFHQNPRKREQKKDEKNITATPSPLAPRPGSAGFWSALLWALHLTSCGMRSRMRTDGLLRLCLSCRLSFWNSPAFLLQYTASFSTSVHSWAPRFCVCGTSVGMFGLNLALCRQRSG